MMLFICGASVLKKMDKHLKKKNQSLGFNIIIQYRLHRMSWDLMQQNTIYCEEGVQQTCTSGS